MEHNRFGFGEKLRNVYDQSAITLDLRSWYDYDTPVSFTLQER